MTRYDQFLPLWLDGWTLAEIGKRFGVSPQWVWMVLNRGEPSEVGRKISDARRRHGKEQRP